MKNKKYLYLAELTNSDDFGYVTVMGSAIKELPNIDSSCILKTTPHEKYKIGVTNDWGKRNRYYSADGYDMKLHRLYRVIGSKAEEIEYDLLNSFFSPLHNRWSKKEWFDGVIEDIIEFIEHQYGNRIKTVIEI